LQSCSRHLREAGLAFLFMALQEWS
jgi:hypothetical protein